MCLIPDVSTDTPEADITVEPSMSTTVPNLQHDPAIVAALRQMGATHINNIDERFVEDYKAKMSNQLGEYRAYTNPSTGKWLYGKLTIK